MILKLSQKPKERKLKEKSRYSLEKTPSTKNSQGKKLHDLGCLGKTRRYGHTRTHSSPGLIYTGSNEVKLPDAVYRTEKSLTVFLQ